MDIYELVKDSVSGVWVSVVSDMLVRLGSDVGGFLSGLSAADFANSSLLLFLRKAFESCMGHYRIRQPDASAMANPYLIRILRLVDDVGLLILDNC